GITADDCADVSRQLSALFDVEDPLPGSYILEVSSPGLDRPLVRLEDFRKRVGEMIKIKLRRPDETGRRNFTGMLVEVTDNEVAIEIDKERFRLPYTAIERARLVPKF
ncbi:MAG TPA: ribosome maturation factor RimP, partial [Burkholderiales bacterium]|nr:ribosome maturation factor RimP [Burkholderiales bacterium]